MGNVDFKILHVRTIFFISFETQCNSIQFNSMQFNAIQFNSIRFIIQFNSNPCYTMLSCDDMLWISNVEDWTVIEEPNRYEYKANLHLHVHVHVHLHYLHLHENYYDFHSIALFHSITHHNIVMEWSVVQCSVFTYQQLRRRSLQSMKNFSMHYFSHLWCGHCG